MKKRDLNFCKEFYKESWAYLKESKNFVYSILVLFLIFFFVGLIFPAPENLSVEILKFIEELALKTAGMNVLELFFFIFWNNLQVGFMGIVLGVVFGVFSILASIVNGYLLGFVSSLVISQEGALSLWRIFPHGIFELPAIFISLGLGVKLGTFFFQKEKKKAFKEYFANSLKVFFSIIIPLLFIAAIIEAFLIGSLI